MKLKPLLFILPSFLAALFVIAYPIFDLLWTSLHDVGSYGNIKDFIFSENYLYVFEDEQFFAVFLRTVLWTISVVFGTIALSLPLAIILSDEFYGRTLARIIIMLPWSVSLVMTAIMWRWALNSDYGMVNHTLSQLGILNIEETTIGWLARASTAFPVEIMIGILVSVPFTVSIFLGGLSSIPQDIYEAAELEGSTKFRQFLKITLPLLKHFISMSIVLNVIYVFNSFPIIWIITEGGPANSTDILPTYLYKLGFRYGEIGPAAALSLLMFTALLCFTLVYGLLVFKKEEA